MILHKVLSFVRRLYTWMPVLWCDHDYSVDDLFPVILHKVRRLRKSMEETSGGHPGSHSIREAEDTLSRVVGHDYAEAPFDLHEAKWGPALMSGEWLFSKATNAEDDATARAEYVEADNQAIRDRQKDIQDFFRLIQDHGHHWYV